jgi:hypothetical protein
MCLVAGTATLIRQVDGLDEYRARESSLGTGGSRDYMTMR